MVQVNPQRRHDPPSIQLGDLSAHVPDLKRSGKVNKGCNHPYMGNAGMVGYRNSYHHGGGQYVIYECDAGELLLPGMIIVVVVSLAAAVLEWYSSWVLFFMYHGLL